MTIKSLLATLLPTFLRHEKGFVSKQAMPSSGVVNYSPVVSTPENPDVWGEVVAPCDGYLMVKNYDNLSSYLDVINGSSSDLQMLISPIDAGGYGAAYVPAKAGDVIRYHVKKVGSNAWISVMFVKSVGSWGGVKPFIYQAFIRLLSGGYRYA